jgi:catechol 2,3-dioxygenase-like lactoylglutathione lyase family enzyme
MIHYKRTDHINICVAPERLEEARSFYTDVLGIQPIKRPDHVFKVTGYWFTVAGIELHIGIERPIERTFRHTAFEVSDLAASRKHLEDHGVQIFEEPVIPNRIRFTFIDPFGNRMELLEYSPTQPSPEGRALKSSQIKSHIPGEI